MPLNALLKNYFDAHFFTIVKKCALIFIFDFNFLFFEFHNIPNSSNPFL